MFHYKTFLHDINLLIILFLSKDCFIYKILMLPAEERNVQYFTSRNILHTH